MSLIKRIYDKVVIGEIKNTEDVPDVAAWNRFLAELPKTNDAVDESYNKYCCRKYYLPRFRQFILNFAALGGLIVSMPGYLTRSRTVREPDEGLLLLVRDNSVPYDDILPEDLATRYPRMQLVNTSRKFDGAMCREGKALFRKAARRHPLSFYYLLLVMKEISNHSRLLEEYSPQAAVVYVNERNVAGPLIRCMYEEGGRCFDSFMHGEYLYQMIQGFMSFSHFYVWADSYVEMFSKDLHCNCGEYIVYTPKKLEKKWNLEEVLPDHFCTYYFSGESTASIRKISKLFKELEERGLHCVVRPHPRYSHLDLIAQEFPHDMIEDAHSVSIRDSIASAEYIVGLTTTVLFEAHAEGKKVVLDDYSDSAVFNSLKERKFRLLKEQHYLLSKVLLSMDLRR